MNNPKLIPAPFAINGQKNSIPDRFSSEMPSNTATWDQGFPPITTLPATAGGLPPIGQDFNGIFNQVSENIVFLSEGGRYKFSEEHAVSIGGYKQGAILQSDDNLSEYQSLIDGNLINFNTAPEMEISAAWKKISPLTLSELPTTVTPLDNDLMLINHSGVDQSITAQKLSDYFNSKLPLSNATNSTSQTTAATSKAVKAAYDFANTKVKTVNGKEGATIALSAEDVGSLPITGGTATGYITAPAFTASAGVGAGANANQLDSKAPFYTEVFSWTPGPGGCYVPLVKGRSSRIGEGYFAAVSFGYVLSGTPSFPTAIIQVAGDTGSVCTWAFDSITGSIGVWDLSGGGYSFASTPWVNTNFVRRIRRGSQQYVKPANAISRYEVPDGYITGFYNETSDGNQRYSGWYYRIPMYDVAGTWVNAVNE